jgi:hypothetical protein
MSSFDRRSYPRRSIELPALVLQERCVEADPAEIRDLSWSGCFVAMPFPSIVGRRVRLLFRLPGRREEVRLTGQVVRITKQGFAVQFEATDWKAESALRQLLGSDAPREDVTEKTLPLTNLAPAANDTPALMSHSWSLRGTIQKLLGRVG